MDEVAALHLSLSICHGKMCIYSQKIHRQLPALLAVEQQNNRIQRTLKNSVSRISRNTIRGCTFFFFSSHICSRKLYEICNQAAWVLLQKDSAGEIEFSLLFHPLSSSAICLHTCFAPRAILNCLTVKYMLCGKATDSQNILCTLICIIKQSALTYLCVRVCFFSPCAGDF